MMKPWLMRCGSLLTLAVLAGCAHPYARIATTQDPKYPVGRQSKIAFPDFKESPNVDLPSRLAGEALEEQMHAMGFTIVPQTEADFLLGFKMTEKDMPKTSTVSVPTITNGVGDIGGHPISGTFFSTQEVPETRMVNVTELTVTLDNTHDPKLTVWQGIISVETTDAQKFRGPFFRALLEHVGETSHGSVQLDTEPSPTK